MNTISSNWSLHNIEAKEAAVEVLHKKYSK